MSLVVSLSKTAGLRLSAALQRHRESRARRTTLRHLEALDASTLRDVGMSRAELISICFADSVDRRRGHV